MKKIALFLFCLLAFFGVSYLIHAEGEENEEPEIVEEQHLGKVIIGECVYGALTTDLEEGEAGQIVNIYANPQIFCRIVAVKVNGAAIAPNAEGKYSFALAEGDNVLSLVCEINQEEMKVIVDLVEKAEKGSWEEIFSLENIFNIISWAISLVMGSGFLLTLWRSKKLKYTTTNEIAAKVEKIVPESVQSVVVATFQPILDNIGGMVANIEEVCRTLATCTILMQENTPESRIAIVNKVTELKKTSESLTAQVKNIINTEVANSVAIAEQKKQAIAELEEKNNNLVAEFEKEEVNGRI